MEVVQAALDTKGAYLKMKRITTYRELGIYCSQRHCRSPRLTLGLNILAQTAVLTPRNPGHEVLLDHVCEAVDRHDRVIVERFAEQGSNRRDRHGITSR